MDHQQLAAAVTEAGGSPCQQNPGLWFGEPGEQARAALLCLECPAFLACLRYLADNPERFGTWAGLTEHERQPKRVRSAKGAAA